VDKTQLNYITERPAERFKGHVIGQENGAGDGLGTRQRLAARRRPGRQITFDPQTKGASPSSIYLEWEVRAAILLEVVLHEF